MIRCREIDEYLDFCKRHPKRINKDRKLLIKNIVIPTLEREDVFFDEETYNKCIRYCESNYYPLFPYQKFIYAFVFMYVDDIPLFGTIIILMGRGNGKDGMMMPLMNFLQTPMYGVRNYHIDIVANNEKQAKDSFNVVYEMLDSSKSKFKKMFYWSKESIINKKTRSELRYNTSNANTKDGKKGGSLLFNELHAYESYDQINVFTSQLGKIKHARTIIITTQGYVRDGPLDDYLSVCRDILNKRIDNEVGYFPFLCCIDDKKQADDPECWELANPSLPFRPILKNQIKKDYLEMKRLPSKRPEFFTKRMNWPDRNDEIMVASWNDILLACYEDIETKTPRKTPELKGSCIIGIDYADIRDFASAGLLFKIDGEYIWRQHTWICRNSPFFESIKFAENFRLIGEPGYEDFEIVDSSSLNAGDIVRWCISQMSMYKVEKIVMDTYRFSIFREAFEQAGIPIETKKNPFGLIRMIRSVSAINTLTAPLIEKSFTDKKINFGTSSIMRWYTNNTKVTIDKHGNKSYGKIEPKLRKNDGFMAFVVAMSAESLLDVQTLII